uniref:Uncharacterized protein n=1 Tax=Lutzomyia longipalpis TaxID=7200 RepID=A0A1B0CRY5_LUTLO
MIEITICWCRQLQCAEANVIEGLIVNAISNVPIPDPVPPPSEWVSWKPWRQSHDSASFRTTSKTESTSSAPSV